MSQAAGARFTRLTSSLGTGMSPSRIGTGAGLAMLALLLGALAALWPRYTLVGVVLIAATTAVFRTPTVKLLPLCALLFLLLPTGYIGLPTVIGRYITPAFLILVLWAARVMREADKHLLRDTGIFPLALCTTSVLLLLVSFQLGVSTSYSLAWILVCMVCWYMPLLVAGLTKPDMESVIRDAFLTVGIVLGIIVIVEYATGFNPWTYLYTAQVDSATYSVFRAKASLGHPLTTMTVSSVCLVINLFSAIRLVRPAYFVAAGMSGIALLLTASRTGVIAVGVGLAVGIVGLLMTKGLRGRGILALFAGAAVFLAVSYSPLLRARDDSREGVSSSTYRSDALNYAWDLFEKRPLFGYGPGGSAEVFLRASGKLLENSGMQLLLSTGLVNVVLIVIFFAYCSYRAFLARVPEYCAGLIAFVTALSGYNALDSNPALIAFSSLLVVGAVASVANSTHDASRKKPESSAWAGEPAPKGRTEK